MWGSQLWSTEPLGQYLASQTALLFPCPSHWLQLPPLLTSSSVALRILAGETIALLFELAQDLEVRQGMWQWEQWVGTNQAAGRKLL